MKIVPSDPPRAFGVGPGNSITVTDCGRVWLDPDEQVTFVTPSGAEYDVIAKAWGFYATPSVNGRLVRFGLRSALVRSADRKRFILMAERSRQKEFEAYLLQNGLTLVAWLDDDQTLEAIEQAVRPQP